MWVLVIGIALAVLLWWFFQKKIETFQAINTPFRYIRISSPTTVTMSQFRIISNEIDITLRNPNISVEGGKPDWQIDLRNDELVDKIIYKGNASPGMTMIFYTSKGSKVGETVTFTADEVQEFDLKTGALSETSQQSATNESEDSSVSGATDLANVSGSSILGENSSLSGATLGSLNGGDTDLNGNLSVSGNAKVTGAHTVVGATTLGSLIAGATDINGNSKISGDLNVSGGTTLGTLNAGATEINGNSKVTGDLNVSGATSVGGNLISNRLLVKGDGNHEESEIGSKNAITASAINGKSGEASIWMGYDPKTDFGYINAARHGAVRPINLQTRGGNSGGAGVGIGVSGDPKAKFHVQGDTLLAGATTVDGDLFSHGLKVSRNWTGYPDNSTTQSEISNDTNGFKQLMIVGNKSGGGERRVGIWDTLNVNGALNISGDTRANGDLYTHGLKVSRNWTGYPDNSTTQSEISNDTNGYKQLMIVGNKSGGGERRVGIWDTLNVNGALNISGDTRANGSFIPKYIQTPYTDAPGNDMQELPLLRNSTFSACKTACDTRPNCRGFNFQASAFPNGTGDCWIKNNVVNKLNTPDWHLFSKNF